MKLAALFSGGKDSCLAMHHVMKEHEVVCLITMLSENDESYMFHVPNIEFAEVQAQAIGLPILLKKTPGVKEEELAELKQAIIEAKEKYSIEGIITGAIRSVYQASRIQKICDELEIKCFNPLWMRDQTEILRELIKLNFKVIISGVFADGFGKEFLGKVIDEEMIVKLLELKEKYKINEAGEGGEIETTVLNAPFFKKEIIVKDSLISYENYAGTYIIKDFELRKK
jgi:diphthine-ammonia ligase